MKNHVIQIIYTSKFAYGVILRWLTIFIDELATENINGVKIVHLAEFLRSDEY